MQLVFAGTALESVRRNLRTRPRSAFVDIIDAVEIPYASADRSIFHALVTNPASWRAKILFISVGCGSIT